EVHVDGAIGVTERHVARGWVVLPVPPPLEDGEQAPIRNTIAAIAAIETAGGTWASRLPRSDVGRPIEPPGKDGAQRCAHHSAVARGSGRAVGSAGLPGAELAIARVAEAGHDVALLVQLAVERCAMDLDVWMGGRDRG